MADDARFCSGCGAEIKRVRESEKERKLATLLFADLVGSTAYAAARDAELVRDTLDRYYDAMTAIVVEHGGSVEKFIGDAVVAVFGAPQAREDHAERALDVALRMQQRFDELFGAELSLRIGVNTGEFVVGRASSLEGYVTGDAVNVAARLEQAAGAGEVFVGERTVAAVGSAFEFDEVQVVEAKGKPEGVPARRLVRLLAPVRPRDRFMAAFIGREEELESLRTRWQECARRSRPGLSIVLGDPGVGKTTLVSQLRAHLAGEATVRVGRCVSFGRNATFSALADILGEDADDAVARREILAMALGGAAPAGVDPRVAAEQLRAAWADHVTELAARGPVLLIVEDIHWASAPLIAVIERMLADVTGPVLVLATSRPEHPPLPEGGHVIPLHPLSDAHIEALLMRLVGGDLPAPARARISRIAEGNPFFLEEVLAALIDQGTLVRHDQGWEWLGDVDTLEVPDTVQALLAARLDLLPGAAKQAVQVAAVIGRVVDPAAIRELADGGDTSEAVARDFLRWEGDALVFKHALTREVAYSSLPKTRRAVLHAHYASWLSARGEDDTPPGLLAHHYWLAVDPAIAELAWRGREDDLSTLRRTALDWLRRAADAEIARYDIGAALTFLDQASRLAPDDAALWRTIGRANALRYAGPAYWESMQRAIELTSDAATLAAMYAELAVESSLRGAMWPKRPPLDLLRSWSERALSLAADGSRAKAQAVLGLALMSDDPGEVDRAVEAAEQLADPDVVSHSYLSRASCHTEFGDYEAAFDWARRREQFVPTINDPDHLSTIYQLCVSTAIGMARFAEANAYVQRMADVCERLTPHHAVHVMGARVSLSEARGDWSAVRALQPEIERMVSTNSVTPCSYNARLLLSCAVACTVTGDEQESGRLEAATSALDLEDYRMWFDPLRAKLALQRGDLAWLTDLAAGAGSWAMPLYVHCFGVAMHLETLLALGELGDAIKLAEARGQPGSYLEPFALRAIGIATNDPGRRSRADELFLAMGLPRPGPGSVL